MKVVSFPVDRNVPHAVRAIKPSSILIVFLTRGQGFGLHHERQNLASWDDLISVVPTDIGSWPARPRC